VCVCVDVIVVLLLLLLLVVVDGSLRFFALDDSETDTATDTALPDTGIVPLVMASEFDFDGIAEDVFDVFCILLALAVVEVKGVCDWTVTGMDCVVCVCVVETARVVRWAAMFLLR